MSSNLPIKAITFILSFIGSIIVFTATYKYGIGLSPDSVEYLAAANNIVAGSGFVTFDARPITEWLPLYPFLLSLISYISGTSIAVSAVIMNSILFGLLIYISGKFLIKYLNTRSIIFFATATILFSVPIFSVAVWTWSELLFIFLTILYIRNLDCYLHKMDNRSLVMVIVITALALLTRYIGLFILLVTLISILAFTRQSLKKKLISIAVTTLLPLIPLSIWVVRNYIVSGTLFGERGASSYPLLMNIYLTIEGVLSWGNPLHLINEKLYLFMVIAAAVIMSLLIVIKIFKYKEYYSFSFKITSAILSLFIAVYLLTLIAVSSVTAHNPIDDRLLSPVYIPVIILFSFFLQVAYNQINLSKYKVPLKAGILIFLYFGVIQILTATLSTIKTHFEKGGGYSGVSWQKESKAEWLKNIREKYIKGSAVYSNDPFAFYYLEHSFVKWGPRKTYYDSEETYIHLKDLPGKWPPEKEAYLIWFNEVEFHNTQLYSPEELAGISDIHLIDSTEVGFLFVVKSREINQLLPQ